MPLLHKGEWLANDPWIHLPDDTHVPESGHDTLIVGCARFIERATEKAALPGGVSLAIDDDPLKLAPWIAALRVVKLNLPAFTDGRAYSQARLLRQRLKFHGEIRIGGDVRVDQLLEMTRVGIDTFEFDSMPDEELVRRNLAYYEAFYQPSYGLPQAV